MAERKVLTSLEEVDAQLILCKEVRQCSGCRQPTFWAAPRQRRLGTCLHCLPWRPVTREVGQRLDERALKLARAAFPGATISFDPHPPMKVGRYGKPVLTLVRKYWFVAKQWVQEWAYLPPVDAGPCAGCHGVIRRWGPAGRMFCVECEAKR